MTNPEVTLAIIGGIIAVVIGGVLLAAAVASVLDPPQDTPPYISANPDGEIGRTLLPYQKQPGAYYP